MVASVVQFASNQVEAAPTATIDVTLAAPPTPGNLLVACVTERQDGGDTFSLSGGVWTLVTTVYSGNGTNWPHRMYYMVAGAGMSATITATFGAIGQPREVGIIELAGVNTLDTFISTSNSPTTTGAITPLAGETSGIVSSVFARTDAGPLCSPVAGMTEWTDIKRLGCNHRMVAIAAGPYTIGSTGPGANSSFIGASFKRVAPSAGFPDGLGGVW